MVNSKRRSMYSCAKWPSSRVINCIYFLSTIYDDSLKVLSMDGFMGPPLPSIITIGSRHGSPTRPSSPVVASAPTLKRETYYQNVRQKSFAGERKRSTVQAVAHHILQQRGWQTEIASPIDCIWFRLFKSNRLIS